METDKDILKTIGLTSAEAKVYIALVELKESKTGELCKKTKIPSSNIYAILDSLIQKGFISHRLQNNVKIFLPSDPEVINDLFEEKQKKLNEQKVALTKMIDSLKKKQSIEPPISKYRYYEGLAGLRSLWLEITHNMKNFPKGTRIQVYSSKKGSYEVMLPIYDLLSKVRCKLKIPYDLILDFENKKHGAKRLKEFTNVKYFDLQNEADFVIINNIVVIQYLTGEIPRAFRIEDPIFAQLFRQVFEQIWKTAKN